MERDEHTAERTAQYTELYSDRLLELYGTGVFTVFDTETTGLDPATERIVEIGALRFDRHGIISRFTVLINPQKPMPQEAAKINGITDELLRGKPAIAEVLPDFLSFIGKTPLVAHNAPFDISFLNAELSRCGFTSIDNRLIDTLALSKKTFPQLGKYSLPFLASHFGIESGNAHRAEDDARVCMELFSICVNGK
ncbi:MAG: 3'-5' exonuclease [Spirochaetaceae bacterium]|jgi:DNA polymerase-3 subunit epsilon|nr:3'-5' exonuclease [Spirochaetaceae bacterium]